jgi:DNA uptake protein ComE-like DNA-binding protein
LPPGDLLHNKFGIIDQETVITGSHNWTEAANKGNDETVLVVHSAIVAAHYQREFERLYTNAILGIPPAIQKKAYAQQRQCQVSQPSSQPSKTLPQPLKTLKRNQTATAPNPTKTVRQQKQPVNLNTATQAELDAIPGVGPKLAARIIAARQQRPIQSLDDLDRISGVGPKLLKRLEPQVTW